MPTFNILIRMNLLVVVCASFVFFIILERKRRIRYGSNLFVVTVVNLYKIMGV